MRGVFRHRSSDVLWGSRGLAGILALDGLTQDDKGELAADKFFSVESGVRGAYDAVKILLIWISLLRNEWRICAGRPAWWNKLLAGKCP